MVWTTLFIFFGLVMLVSFAQELSVAAKKWFERPWVRFVVPLCLVTQVLFFFEFAQYGTLFFLRQVQYGFTFLYQELASFLPFWSENLAKILLVWSLSLCIPWILVALNRRKMLMLLPYKPILAVILWLFWALLCVCL